MSDRIDAPILPPSLFVADPVECAVMGGAEGHHPLVAHLAAQGTRLGKTQVMGMARAAGADETGLLSYIAKVISVSNAPWGADREDRFVDLAWSAPGLG